MPKKRKNIKGFRIHLLYSLLFELVIGFLAYLTLIDYGYENDLILFTTFVITMTFLFPFVFRALYFIRFRK